MKKLKLLTIVWLMGINWFIAGGAMAHTGLSTSVPGDGATVNLVPETLDLTFSEEVNLLKVTLSNSEDSAIAIDFTPSATAATHFAIAMPALEEGGYTVSWTILGSDSHRVEGEFSFTYDAGAAVSMGHSTAEHGEH